MPPRLSLFGGRVQIGGGADPWIDEVIGPSGARYQFEVEPLWDDETRGHIR